MQTHLLHPQFSLDRGILKEGDAQVDGLGDAGTLLTISPNIVLPRCRVQWELAGIHALMTPFSNVPVVYLGKFAPDLYIQVTFITTARCSGCSVF